MKIHSIKFKITCWYTGIITLLFGVIFLCALWYLARYSEEAVGEELRDEAGDLLESIYEDSSDFLTESRAKNGTLFFDDGIMLSIYGGDSAFIDGIFPEDFPEDTPLEQGGARKIRRKGRVWFVYDRKAELSDGRRIWIRGIYSGSSFLADNLWVIRFMEVLFPLIAVLTGFVGYRMLVKALRPVLLITETANEITSSMTLSRRIPVPVNKDEIYELCRTLNRMLESLEKNFLRERQFSSDAAHELRTPVSVILSHCEYCLEELDLPEEAESEIQIIQKKARQMSELVSRLLEIARSERKKDRLEKEAVDLALLAESVAEELQEKAEQKEITIGIDNRLQDPVILADMSMMTRLFINLTDNAVVYGRKRGYLTIHMEEEEGDQVRIRFEDNGIGIPPEEQERIWDRFYQVDASHTRGENFGLGLFMVRQIADWHGGTVAVRSRPGGGSTFTVILPRKSGEASPRKNVRAG